MIALIGFGFLGFLIGLAIGSDDQRKTIQKAFEKEGYSYSEFHDVLFKNNK